MKKITLLVFLIISFQSFSQKKSSDYKFGFISTQEKDMMRYEKDTAAVAVVLYEHGYSDFFDREYRAYLRTKVYKKIKILKEEGKEYADVEFYLYKNENNKETVRNIKASTYYQGKRVSLNPDNIYKTEVTDRVTKVSFAMPEIHSGSIIEYSYVIESPFLFNLTGWDFQDYIPKIESVFKAKVAGNFVYNRKLVGELKLAVNDADLIKNCFEIQGVRGIADCELLTYAMHDVPAFIEEDYMTTADNFISRIAFELSEYRSFNGQNKKYTTTWKAVDKDFKSDKDIGGQLKRVSYFEDFLTTEILNEENALTKANKIYTLIQNHYTWNEKYHLFRNMNVKKAFKEGIGTVGEINMSLINVLTAAGFDAKMGLLSTRQNGFPTKIHPVISDFNYLVARVVINDKIYLLDATNKNNPFGVLPFRCLNKDVRIMDFKNGSYWEDIVPINKNRTRTNILVSLNDLGDFEGKIRIVNTGYKAINKREILNNYTTESYRENFEASNEGLFIKNYEVKNLNEIGKSLTEEFEIEIENDETVGDKIILNPFIIGKISENPFKLEERNYPVDFGFTRESESIISIEIPDNYVVESLPESVSLKLPDNTGSIKFKIDATDYKIRAHFKYLLNKPYFYSYEYTGLKEFYKQIIKVQNQPVVLKKETQNAE